MAGGFRVLRVGEIWGGGGGGSFRDVTCLLKAGLPFSDVAVLAST